MREAQELGCNFRIGLHAILKPAIEPDHHRAVENQRGIEGDLFRVPDALHKHRRGRTAIAISDRL
jgi:hypothetical protein